MDTTEVLSSKTESVYEKILNNCQNMRQDIVIALDLVVAGPVNLSLGRLSPTPPRQLPCT